MISEHANWYVKGLNVYVCACMYIGKTLPPFDVDFLQRVGMLPGASFLPELGNDHKNGLILINFYFLRCPLGQGVISKTSPSLVQVRLI